MVRKSRKPALKQVAVFIPSAGLDTINEQDANGIWHTYVYGSLNGVPFKVRCDEFIAVPPEVAFIIQHLMR